MEKESADLLALKALSGESGKEKNSLYTSRDSALLKAELGLVRDSPRRK